MKDNPELLTASEIMGSLRIGEAEGSQGLKTHEFLAVK